MSVIGGAAVHLAQHLRLLLGLHHDAATATTREERQGVVGLYQPGLTGEQSMGLSVRFMGISRSAIASYLISLYCSLAVLTEDALAVLDGVEVGKFHDYAHVYR